MVVHQYLTRSNNFWKAKDWIQEFRALLDQAHIVSRQSRVLDITSAPSKGTGVKLPDPLQSDGAGPHHEVQPFSLPRRQQQREIRMVIVDDHAMVREGLRGLLELRSHLLVVGEAGDGEEALRMIRDKTPDLVIMDINMPRMNGIEATRRLKEIAPRTKVIGLSYHDDEQRIQMMRSAGADAYISKGGSSDELFQTIQHVMLEPEVKN